MTGHEFPARETPAVSGLAELFRSYAATGAGDEAPLNRTLASAVADDTELLDLVAAAPPEAHHPNSLLAAVRFLLLAGTDHPFVRLFGDDPVAGSEAELVTQFRDYVMSHRAAVVEAMASRSIQTNEPARSAVIAPALARLHRRHGPLALIDVGTSAGLNLMVDRVHIDYGTVAIGPSDAALRLRCELLGRTPELDGDGLGIVWRRGLDRAPIDLEDEPSRRWLRACVWADQAERRDRLDQAIAMAREQPPPIVTGDAIDALPALLTTAPGDLHLTIVATWVAFYFSPEQRAAFEAILATARRPVSWVSLELPGVVPGIDRPDGSPSTVITPSVLAEVSWEATRSSPGEGLRRFLGWGHHHGTWLDWHG